jgi:predicted enzyme related to lactoylglutathione lyase
MQDVVFKTVVHFEIPAGDVEKLSKFYTDSFGWKFKKMPMGDFEYWMISTGPEGKTVSGGMYKKMGTEGPKNYIAVEEIDSAIATFEKAGGKEVMGKQRTGQGWTFLGADPEGNVIGIFQSTRKQIRWPAAKKRNRK